jgi:hypothetical protein
MEEWPQFILMVDSDLDPAAFRARLAEIWPDAESTGGRTLILPDQVMEIFVNDEFDATRVNDPDVGRRYFKYEIQVSPLDLDATVETQASVARELRARLESADFRVAVVADFEGSTDRD